jgi:hypothetical protein
MYVSALIEKPTESLPRLSKGQYSAPVCSDTRRSHGRCSVCQFVTVTYITKQNQRIIANCEMFTKCVWTIRTAWEMSSCSRNGIYSYVAHSVGEVTSEQAVSAHECVQIFAFWNWRPKCALHILWHTVSCEVHMTSRNYKPFRDLHAVRLQSVPILTPMHCHIAHSNACCRSVTLLQCTVHSRTEHSSAFAN